MKAKAFLQQLLISPDVNSRFISLLTGVITAFCTLLLVVAFIFDKNGIEYTEMLLVLLSGGVVGGGFARFLTKKSSSSPAGSSERTIEVGK